MLFIIFLNDIVDVISNAKIIRYADDTIIYVADKDIKIFKSNLFADMNAIADRLGHINNEQPIDIRRLNL